MMSDPAWNGGDYYDSEPPARGLSVARMIGHITYMSDLSMREKFGRRQRPKDELNNGIGVDFEVENYLRYRGGQFVNRFDANSYLYITKAMDNFDLAASYGGSLSQALARAKARFLVISFTSDWLYPSYQSQEIVRALRGHNKDVTYCEIESNYGHDAFLVEVGQQTELVKAFLANTYKKAQAA
jgi:homoserine O-acetyltransferase